MKKILMATVGLMALGLAAPASAADMAARPMYTKAPAYAAPVLSWTGFYIGANVGGAWSANNSFGATGFSSSNNGSFMGGGQIGADYQFAPNWLVGIEANVDGIANNNGDTFSNGAVVATRNHDYLGSVTGRLGYVFGPAVVYAKGGLGFTDTKYSLATAGGSAIPFTNSGNNNTGYTVGGGLEYMFAPNWSAKLEYQYFNFNKGQQYISAAFPAGVSVNDNEHTFKLGVNYHFNAGGPVVARY